MKINYVEGDLFAAIDGVENIIIPHCCNNKHGFGAGFVVPLGRKFPIVKKLYLEWGGVDCIFWSNDPERALVPFGLGETQIIKVKDTSFVANMVGQTLGGTRPLFYNHLCKCMDTVADFAMKHNLQIIAPMFGSNLAGGNWLFIEQLIEDCWLRKNIPVTIHYLLNDIPDGWTIPIKD